MRVRSWGVSVMLAVVLCLSLNSAWAADVRGVTDKEIKLACLVDLSDRGNTAAAYRRGVQGLCGLGE